MADDLHELVRQLKAELEWASRIGVEPPDGTEKPPVIVRDVEPYAPPVSDRGAPSAPSAPRASSARPSPAGRAMPGDAHGPEPTDPGPARPAAPREVEPTPPPPVDATAASEAEALETATSLVAVREILGDCRRCKLCAGRTQIVFGVGNENAEVMFIGEGPGSEEDRRGEPFVGKAGQLLTRIIENGMGMSRADVYIANIVKCRPPNNRDPEPDEVAACEPFLAAQIRVISPKVIITLGKWASQTLLRTSTPITRLRGQWSEYMGTPVMPTYHPAYLLRNPAEKRPVWEDIQEVLKWLGRPLPSRS